MMGMMWDWESWTWPLGWGAVSGNLPSSQDGSRKPPIRDSHLQLFRPPVQSSQTHTNFSGRVTITLVLDPSLDYSALESVNSIRCDDTHTRALHALSLERYVFSSGPFELELAFCTRGLAIALNCHYTCLSWRGSRLTPN